MNFDNKVELLNHSGSDLIHCKSIWLGEGTPGQRDDQDGMLRNMRSQISKNRLDVFNSSSFTFLLKIDLFSYIFILRTKKGNINDHPFRDYEHKKQYYIPFDWHQLISKGNNGEFIKKGDNWYNILMKYTELGYELAEQFRNEDTPAYSRKRRMELSNLFKPFNSHTDLTLTLSFKDFVEFYKISQEYESTIEIQDIGREMLDLIRNIEGRPFSKSLRVFNLNKE